MGASALVVAAAFAVAFAVLVSSTSNETAEAAEVTLTGTSVDAQPGDTVIIPGPGTPDIVDFSITGGTATGSFDSGGGQSVSCSDSETGTGCDVNTAADAISVKLNIDADSPDGYITVKRDVILPVDGSDDTIVITVTTQPKPASLTAKAVSTTIDANGAIGSDTDPGRTKIVATVKNDQSPSAGMDGQRVTFITTLGVMNCPGSTAPTGGTDIAAATNVQWCQVWTSTVDDPTTTAPDAVPGKAVIDLLRSNREGTATVTVTHGTLDATTVDVTLFGTAKNLSARADQGSVEVGGSVFVVLTVTDGAGNPVKDVQPQPAAKDPIVGPTKTANKVTTSQAADDGVAATSPYNVNKDVDKDGAVDKGDIPACGPVTAVPAAPDADPPVQGVFVSTGTNDAGQCVVQVNATPDDATTTGTNEASARGVHTLNFELAKLKADVEITVSGGPATIDSDAPDYVEPLSDTTITVTVRDDEGVLVGATNINVIQVAGEGLTEGAATKENAKTKNGSAKFSYAAGLEGRVVFRVIAGSGTGEIRDIITLMVGAPAPEPVPEPDPAPTLSPTPSATGVTLVTFNGGSVSDLAEALAAQCSGGRAYATDYQGNWVAYIPGAPSVVNAPFNNLFADGIEAGRALLVTGCGS